MQDTTVTGDHNAQYYWRFRFFLFKSSFCFGRITVTGSRWKWRRHCWINESGFSFTVKPVSDTRGKSNRLFLMNLQSVSRWIRIWIWQFECFVHQRLFNDTRVSVDSFFSKQKSKSIIVTEWGISHVTETDMNPMRWFCTFAAYG